MSYGWADLPPDLLRDVSPRLNDATDYVRFHAVCRSWRDTLPPEPHRPTFQPWLVSPRDATGHRKARCVFSRSPTLRMVEIPGTDLVISSGDGVAALVLNRAGPEPTSGLLRCLFGPSLDTRLPRFPDEAASWLNSAAGVVAGDGTIVIYADVYVASYHHGTHTLEAAVLRPGDKMWTTMQRDNLYFHCPSYHSSMAYRHGKMVLCNGGHLCFLIPVGQSDTTTSGSGVLSQWSYLLESRGQVLWVFVQIKTNNAYYTDRGDHSDVGSLASAFTLSVYAMQEEEGGNKLRWVKMDRWSLNDRILFLGCPSSFAVDAALLGMNGGCAYFVDRWMLYSMVWSKIAKDQCLLFRYSFHDDMSELVDNLLDGWGCVAGAYFWITPRPTITPTESLPSTLQGLQKPTK